MSDELVSEWVAKAEEDWTAVARLQTGAMADVANAIVFHAQQCAEKYLKALVQHGGVEPPRMHHLATLLDLLAPQAPELEALRPACEGLTPYAVNFRYPGEQADEDDARAAIGLAEAIRSAARGVLDLDSESPAPA
jgi:HEPN domain-containing protein